jgi:HD superfamily phosphohydrolase YqeK
MLDELRQSVRPYLSAERYLHTLGVEKEMRALSHFFLPSHITEGAAAALLHDITKRMTFEEQLSYCNENGLAVTDEERAAPSLLHSKTGAHFIRVRFPSFATDAVVSAIQKHTAADEGMSIFDSLLYLADFIEEGRTYSDCIALRRLFYENAENRLRDKELFLNELFLEACNLSLLELIRDNRTVSSKTVVARNEALRQQIVLKGKK